MKSKHIKTVAAILTFEVGYVGEIGKSGLFEAVTEALEKVVDEAKIVYIRGSAPDEDFVAFDMWVPPEVLDTAPPEEPSEATLEGGGDFGDLGGGLNASDEDEPTVIGTIKEGEVGVVIGTNPPDIEDGKKIVPPPIQKKDRSTSDRLPHTRRELERLPTPKKRTKKDERKPQL